MKTLNTKQVGSAYLVMLIAYIIADYVWLGIIAKESYVEAMGALLRDSNIWWPFAVFYFGYCGCLLFLAVTRDTVMSVGKCAIAGAVVGLASYGAYNLTNYAIIQGFPLSIMVKDWAWGIGISAVVSAIGRWVVNKLG